MTVEHPTPKRRGGIYLLPNLFTTAGLFAGFYAIVAATIDRFEAEAIAIFVALIMDSLDGRIARLTNTLSDFGKEYDSLSVMIAFGRAPSLVMYEWALSSFGELGWLAAFIYAAGAALRLARFNVQHGVMNKRYFQGLASPAAAAVVASMVWVGNDFELRESTAVGVVGGVLTVMVALLMVSNVRYRSFKDFDLRGKVPFIAIGLMVLIFVLISVDPPQVLFLIAFGYAVSGPVMTLMQLQRTRARRRSLAGRRSHHDKQDQPPAP